MYENSKGIPRLINVLCDTALVYGYAELRKRISDAQILAVLEDKAKAAAVDTNDAKQPAPDPQQQTAEEPGSVVKFDEKMARELFSYMRKK